MCDSFESKQFVGSLCHPLCVQKTLRLTECPNTEGHDGKDYVFIAHRLDAKDRQIVDKIVVKARSLTTFELIGSNNWKQYFKSNKQLIINSINRLMTERFGHKAINQSDYHYIDLLSDSKQSENSWDKTSLSNLWLVIQDNEYVLSRFYPTIFPPVVGTCGHFYGVQYADPILDLSYFTPNIFLFKSQSLLNRIEVGVKVMQFLSDFQTIDPKLELCDIKFEHLGFIGGKLYLIDSDMIYSKKSTIDSIESLANCQKNSDCDFIDCKGVCLQNKCSVDDSDDDLKRICRNIFFMGKLYWVLRFGLFSIETDDQRIRNGFETIFNHCFQRTHLLSDIRAIIRILTHLKSIAAKQQQ